MEEGIVHEINVLVSEYILTGDLNYLIRLERMLELFLDGYLDDYLENTNI